MKPIYLTDTDIEKLVTEFRGQLEGAKLADGEFVFRKKYEYAPGKNTPKVSITFTGKAYAKMLALLRHYDSEVAWHGTVERRSDTVFAITDIMVYPQEVTGATVNTDQEAYQQWLLRLDDEVFNSLRMQGHSHVNMGTTPSTVDTTHQEKIIQQMKGTDFYIFMIWNKRLEHTIRLYDYATNTYYEDSDVVISVEGCDEKAFLAESDAVVKRKSYAPVQSSPTAAYVKGSPEPEKPKKRGRPPKDPAPVTRFPNYRGRDKEDRPDYDQMIFGRTAYPYEW